MSSVIDNFDKWAGIIVQFYQADVMKEWILLDSKSTANILQQGMLI
jgi:hypothetical protein